MINEIQVIKELKYNTVKESENTISQYSRKLKLHFYVIYLNEYKILLRNKLVWTQERVYQCCNIITIFLFFFFVLIYKTIKADIAEKTNEVASLKIA